MKNFFSKTTYAILLFAIVFISCNKDSDDILIDSEKIESRSSRVLPSNRSGMLEFATKSDLSDHFDYIGTLSVEEELSLETSLGYTSIRSIYNGMSESEMDARTIKIDDPFLAAVLNEHHEFIVEGTVYKYISDHIMTNGPISEIGKIISMRNSNKIWDEGLKIHDDKLKREIFDDTADGPVDPVDQNEGPADPELTDGTDDDEIELRSPCSFEIEVLDQSGDDRIYYRLIGMNQDGDRLENCQAKLTIDYGDGTVDTETGFIEDIRVYTYDLPLGAMGDFSIDISVEPLFCGTCDDGVASVDFAASSSVICSEFEACDDGQFADVIYGGASDDLFMARCIMGYNADDYLWHDARAWGQIIHHVKAELAPGAFFYIPSPWKVNAKITIRGAVFGETCTGTRYPVFSSKTKNKKEFKHQWKLDDVNIIFRSDDDLFCDFEIFNQNVSSNGNTSFLGTGYSSL